MNTPGRVERDAIIASARRLLGEVHETARASREELFTEHAQLVYCLTRLLDVVDTEREIAAERGSLADQVRRLLDGNGDEQ